MMKPASHLFRRLTTAACVLLLAFVATLSTARAQETTGGIEGTVQDPTGAVIGGASIVLTGSGLIGQKAIVTDSAGNYRFVNLAPGSYALLVRAKGFSEVRKTDIRVQTGRMPTIDIQLAIGSEQTVVEVAAEAAQIDPTQSRSQTNISQEQIDSDPHGRSFQSVIQYAPGSRVEPLQGNGYSIDGATSSENQYLINGIATSALDSGQSKANIPFEFLSEVQVKTSGIDAEYGGALGGVVTAVQRQGGNSWHGSVFMQYEADALDASPASYTRFDPQAKTPATRADVPLQRLNPIKDHQRFLQPGFTVGGPLFRDRLWSFTGFAPYFTSLRRTVNFNYAGPPPVSGPRIFTQDTQQYYLTERLDLRATEKIRLFGSWLYQYYRASGTALPNADALQGQFNSSSTSNPDNFNHGIGNVQPNSVYTTGADITLTPSLVATTRYGYFYQNYQDRGLPIGIRDTWNNSGLNVTAINGAKTGATSNASLAAQSTGYANIAANSQYTALQNVAHQFNQDIAWYKKGFFGQHNLKGGYAFNHLYYNTANIYNTALVQLYWGTTYTPLAANQPNCVAIEQQNLARYGSVDNKGNTTIDPKKCMGNYGYAQVREYSNGNGNVSENNHALYIQDGWQLAKGVTLNLGVRFEKEYVPSFNLYPSGINFGWGGKIVPRLGGAWDVFQNGKLKVFGSYGSFNDVFKLNLAIGSFGGNYWHNCVYALDTEDWTTIQPKRDAKGHYCSGTGEANFAQGSTPGNLRFIENQDYRIAANDPANPIKPGVDPNLKSFRQHESVFGTEYALSRNLTFEARWSRRRVDHAIEDTGIQTPAGEAFPISNPGEGIDKQPVPNCPNCKNQPKAARAYDGVEFRVTKLTSNHWFGSAAYTYSHLRGNYSGLVDSDVADGNATTAAGIRNVSPNSGRAFDEPHFQFDAYGRPFNGLLATDRPHSLKLQGHYVFSYLQKHETTLGLFQVIYSGTPLSSYLDVAGAGSYQVYPEGRGKWIPVTADANGFMSFGNPVERRTPTFFQTDFNFNHAYKVSDKHESWQLAFAATITNLLNTKRPVIYGTKINTPNKTDFIAPPNYTAGGTLNYAVLEGGYDYKALANGANGSTPLTLNSQYGVPTAFQGGRTIRLNFLFKF